MTSVNHLITSEGKTQGDTDRLEVDFVQLINPIYCFYQMSKVINFPVTPSYLTDHLTWWGVCPLSGILSVWLLSPSSLQFDPFLSRLPILQGGTFTLLAPSMAMLSMPQWSCPAWTQNASLVNTSSAEFTEVWQSRMRAVSKPSDVSDHNT